MYSRGHENGLNTRPVKAATAGAFTTAGVRRGFLLAQPLAPGTMLYGVVFGVLASERGLAWLQALLMSVFVYSGSAQLAVLQSWSQSALVAPLVATVLVINARYVLYGASIQPWLVQATRRQAFGSLFFLGDGSWALAMREYQAGYRDAGFILGSGLATFAPWIGGTLLGFFLGNILPQPATFGLDFMLVAFAAAIGISVWPGRAGAAPAVAAGLVAGAVGAWQHGR